MHPQQAPLKIVHATRLTDGKPLALDPSEIWYGRPVKGHLISTAILHWQWTPGDVPYHRVNSRRFSPEIRIEHGLNEKAGRS